MLTPYEIRSFQKNGYLIKRDILDKGLIEKCLNHYWKSAPEGFQRDNPSTWRGKIHKNSFTKERIIHAGDDWKDLTLGNIPEGRGIIAENAIICASVNALLPENTVIVNMWTRGLFGVLPGANGRAPHIDGARPHPFIGVTGLLSDVDVDGGAFTVYPESHHVITPIFETLTKDDLYLPSRWKPAIQTKPVQFTGQAGDIIFWHHNLVHLYTQNKSPSIRLATFTDFRYKEVS